MLLANATITTVRYRWGYQFPRPTGLRVLLCNDGGTKCFDVTTVGSGTVNFDGESVSANTPVRFYARVDGTGTMSPLIGEQGQFRSEL
ncbi:MULTISPECIES: flagellar protein FlhE [Brenneria]|uniref:Flagellar protein FlhE n=1 Tax=Brenneria nigrifluens DSM 30175 = ATCC 13028 TaxID=1121120 RepID=A0A2U1UPL8_9GAMM|nr:hypothetical protein DDT54_14350 [Brenneria nigrifluens DSM 30175 = ATCC 13028]QCR06176.1 hypothetical protein EH206_19655 [Brenneria nigrifluens DSM 30175 = ATCC 13028]